MNRPSLLAMMCLVVASAFSPTTSPQSSLAPYSSRAPEPWTQIISDSGGFWVKFPSAGEITQATVPVSLLNLTLQCPRLVALDSGAFWQLEYCDLPGTLLSQLSQQVILEAAADATRERFAVLPTTWQVRELDASTYPILPGEGDSNLKGDALGKFKALISIADHRLYFVTTYIYEERGDIWLQTMQPFLDSFSVDPHPSIAGASATQSPP